MKYFIISGDLSGQMKASKLIKNISLEDKNAFFYVYGSKEMRDRNVEVLYDFNKLKIMGFVGVLFNIFEIFKVFKNCKKDLLKTKPDLLILIDFGGFNLRISKFAFLHHIKIVYFIPPKVWAWHESRINYLKKYVKDIIVIFKFEYQYYSKKGLNVHYFGNPDFEEILIKKENSIQVINKIALLTGSRQQEVNSSLPIFEKLASLNANTKFVVAGLKNLEYKFTRNLSNLEIIYNQTLNLLENSEFAFVVSGTASLEASILKIPHAVCYKTNIVNYLIIRTFIKVRFIALPNLILNKFVVKEFIQEEFKAINLNDYLKNFKTNLEFKKSIQEDFEKIKNTEHQLDSSKKIASKIVLIAKND